MSPSPTLRIAVLGAGQIGSAFAFQLARTGGHKLTLIARSNSRRLSQLQRDKAVVDTKGERAEVEVAEKLDAGKVYDLVLVTMLNHQVDAVLPDLQESKAACIQFMFNTFEPERLRDAVGAYRCAFGMPFVQARINDDGRLNVTIGAMGQKSLMDQERWVDVFNAAGLPAALEPQTLLWLRCHTPLCVAFESVSVAAVRRGGGASWAQAMVIARGVLESFRLIQGLGYPIYPNTKARLAGSPAAVIALLLWAMSRNASFRELLATGAAECRALVDVMVAAASRSNRPVSVASIAAIKPSVEP